LGLRSPSRNAAAEVCSILLAQDGTPTAGDISRLTISIDAE
jgi:hypothetical protein